MLARTLLMAALAALALGCGKRDGAPAKDAAKPGAPSPIERDYRLEGGQAVDVDALFALLDPLVAAEYERASFDSRLGATVVTGLRLEGVATGEGANIERAEFYGVDLAAIERIRTGEGGPAADFETAFEKIRLFGVTPDAEAGERVTIGAVELDRLKMRRGGLSAQEDGNLARFFNAVDLAGAYVKDFAAEGGDENGGRYSLSAPDVRIVGLAGGKLGAVIANDFVYELGQSFDSANEKFGPAGMLLDSPLRGIVAPDNQRTTVETFEWRGLDLSGWMQYALRGEEPPVAAKNLISLGEAKALNSETYIGDRRAARAAETTFSATEFSWLAPTKIRSQMRGGEYDFTAYAADNEAAANVLRAHGLDKVKATSDLAWDWDAAKGDAAFSMSFDTDGLADLSTRIDLAGLDLAEIRAATEAGDENAAMRLGKLKGLKITLSDEKLLDAMFDLSALDMTESGAELRRQAPMMVRLTGAALIAVNPRMADYVDAVAQFLASGGTLEIAASPREPVPFEALAATAETSPEAAPDLLNLTVTRTD